MEAKMVRKIAVPIEDIYRLPSTKPKMTEEPDEWGEFQIDEDTYGDEIWEEVEPGAKDDIRVPGHETGEWYDTLSFLGTSVVLIPFDRDELTEKDVDALGRVFGHYTSDYDDLRENVNSFSTEAYSKEGDLDTLKIVFPGLWKSIEAMIKQKGLDESNITYFLFNEKTPPPRGFFQAEVSPRYMGHDIGHIEEDSGESIDFKHIIISFLSEASKYYFLDEDDDEPGESLYDFLLGKGYEDDEYIDDEYLMKLIPEFFDTFSAEGDELYDVFGDLMKGEHEVDFPDSIGYYDQGYKSFIKTEDDAGLLAMKEPFMKEMEQYAKGDSGPLSSMKGSVILYDTGL
jgi:hypothetical protein